MTLIIPKVPSEVPPAPGLSRDRRRIVGGEVRILGVVIMRKLSLWGEKDTARSEQLRARRARMAEERMFDCSRLSIALFRFSVLLSGCFGKSDFVDMGS
jgi:hypothetical protein